VFAAHVVVLHQDEAFGVAGIPAELDVAPLDRHEFSAAQPRTHCHQQQGIVLGANLLSSPQELLNFLDRKRDALGDGRLCPSLP
jgi:hypothetical protein